MRITFLLTQSLESPGGGGRYLPLAKSLVRAGHEVKIVALHHDLAAARERSFVHGGVAVEYVGQMHVRKIGDHKHYYSPLSLLWVTGWATLRLTWAALRTPTDLIQVGKTQPMNGLAAWIAHKVRRLPVYVDSDDYEAVNNRFGGPWQQRVVAWFEDWMPSFAQAVTVGTSFIGDRFKQLGYAPEKIVLVPNGADPERFAVLDAPDLDARLERLRGDLGMEPHHRLVVYVGTMSLTSHAIDLLLEAFREVARQEADARLLLVGAGEDIDELRRMAQELGIAGQVRFVGRVPLAQVPLYYRLADVTADPMRISLPARSSLSLKLVESVVAGVPCVTADIGDRRATVGEAGLAVPPDDPLALAEALLFILNHPQAANSMRQAAREMRDDYWWDARVQAFLRLYAEAR